jgi:hypothetical protein
MLNDKMSSSNTVVAILLALALGLSTSISVAHSHDDHHEDDCVITVLQNADTSLSLVISVISLPAHYQNQPAISIGTAIPHNNNGFFARAPPLSV